LANAPLSGPKRIWPITRLSSKNADLAASEKQTANSPAIGVFAVSPVNDLFILERVRERFPVECIVPRIKEVADRWRPEFVGVEATGFQVVLVAEARGTQGFPAVKELHPEGRGKLVRATAALIRAEASGIFLARGAAWVGGFLEELAAFTGEGDWKDDQVDVLAYAAQWVQHRTPTRQTPQVYTTKQALPYVRPHGAGRGDRIGPYRGRGY